MQDASPTQPRIGVRPSGPRDAISDVPGVTVGHYTLADAAQQTGVTVVRPHAGDPYRDKVPAAAQCDTSAVQRNLAFGRKYKITGTPTVIFTNNTRVPGAISAQEVEKNLAAAAAAR